MRSEVDQIKIKGMFLVKTTSIFLLFALVASSAQAAIITSAEVTYTGTGYIIGSQDGAFFDPSVSNPSPGYISVGLLSFSSAPRCIVTPTNGSTVIAAINGSPTTTTLSVNLYSNSMSVDSSFDVICVGN